METLPYRGELVLTDHATIDVVGIDGQLTLTVPHRSRNTQVIDVQLFISINKDDIIQGERTLDVIDGVTHDIGLHVKRHAGIVILLDKVGRAQIQLVHMGGEMVDRHVMLLEISLTGEVHLRILVAHDELTVEAIPVETTIQADILVTIILISDGVHLTLRIQHEVTVRQLMQANAQVHRHIPNLRRSSEDIRQMVILRANLTHRLVAVQLEIRRLERCGNIHVTRHGRNHALRQQILQRALQHTLVRDRTQRIQRTGELDLPIDGDIKDIGQLHRRRRKTVDIRIYVEILRIRIDIPQPCVADELGVRAI